MSPILTQHATVPAYNCPDGTKLWLLNLGVLECDEAFLMRGAGTSTASNPAPVAQRRELSVIAALVKHATEGLFLFETGCAEDLEVKWGAPLTDIFYRKDYSEGMKLPAAIKATGNDIKDVKAVIMGHLHLDHAGGLEHFQGSNIPIYCHQLELQHAFWAVATKADLGVYLPSYLTVDLNWKTFSGDRLEIFQGVTLHLMPGHTPGLCILQLNLQNSGTFIFTTDQFHVKENYESGVPQGWLAREHNDWIRSTEKIKILQRNFAAKLIFGHCKETFETFKASPNFYD